MDSALLRSSLCAVLLAGGTALAQECGEQRAVGCRELRARYEVRARGCVLRFETIAVGYHDDSAGEVLLREHLAATFVGRDGGEQPAQVLASEEHVEGSSATFELWTTPTGALLNTTQSVRPPDADGELGPMDTAQSLEWVTVEPSCRLARTSVAGEYEDAATRERLVLSTPTLPHAGSSGERLRVEYASARRPKLTRLAVASFDPEQRSLVATFRDGSAYRIALEPGALVVTPVAGGKSQRFLRR